MIKTKNSYRRSGENIRVPGFSYMDTYEQFIQRAGKALAPFSSQNELKEAAIIVSNSKVLNMPSDGEARWSLGGYLSETGGFSRKNKMIFGIYIPELDENQVIWVNFIFLLFCYICSMK